MTAVPCRVQWRRTPGWVAPLDHLGRRPVYVGRGSRYGNPWKIVRQGGAWAVVWAGDDRLGPEYGQPHNGAYSVACAYESTAREVAVRYYGEWLFAHFDLAARFRAELAGRSLTCWCAEELPCHADFLLRLAAVGGELLEARR